MKKRKNHIKSSENIMTNRGTNVCKDNKKDLVW